MADKCYNKTIVLVDADGSDVLGIVTVRTLDKGIEIMVEPNEGITVRVVEPLGVTEQFILFVDGR